MTVSVCPSKVLDNIPSFFHILTVLSNELDAINNPEGEIIAFVISLLCPKNFINISSDSKSQTFITLSLEVVII